MGVVVLVVPGNTSGVATVGHGWVVRFAQIRRVFWRNRGRVADSTWVWRYTVYMNTSRRCVCLLQIVYAYLASGGFAPDPHRGSAPGPCWGTSVRKPPVPTLPPNPGYATGWQYPFYSFYLFINIQWLDMEMTSLISCPPYSSKTSRATVLQWLIFCFFFSTPHIGSMLYQSSWNYKHKRTYITCPSYTLPWLVQSCVFWSLNM